MAKAPVGEIVKLAVLAEQMGYDRCWLFDEGIMTRDVFVTLAAIAERTSTIKIGPGITNPYVRHPGSTAAAIASIDELSDGRAFIGVGAGGGLALGPLAVERTRPLQVVADAVTAMRGLFAADTVTMTSETFALNNARLEYARPDIEIIMAGRGPRMTSLGGRISDGFYLSYPYLPALADQVKMISDAAAGEKRHIAWSTGIARDEHELQQMRAQLTFRLVDSPTVVREALGISGTPSARLSLMEAPRGQHISCKRSGLTALELSAIPKRAATPLERLPHNVALPISSCRCKTSTEPRNSSLLSLQVATQWVDLDKRGQPAVS